MERSIIGQTVLFANGRPQQVTRDAFMPIPVQLQPHIVDARQRLTDARYRLQQQHDAGCPGIQICTQWADVIDGIVLELFEAAIMDSAQRGDTCLVTEVSLVPHGGYGRRDVAPFSDVDIMLLHTPSSESRVRQLAKRLVVDVCDVGFDLGFSLRTPFQAVSLAVSDPMIFTSLVEARYLVGSVGLYRKFVKIFRHRTRSRVAQLIDRVNEARRGERLKYGETVFLLEPNVKRSPGGLRDLQLVRWVGFARYGEADYDSLRRMDVLSAQDHQRLRRAVDFLLQIRNELHFHAGRASDVLNKNEQLRLTDKYQYQGVTGVRPVEQFMQEYFHHTSETRAVVSHFTSCARPRSYLLSLVAPLFSHRVGRDYRVGPIHIVATRTGKELLKKDLAEVLRLMDLANLYNKWIDPDTWNTIRASMEELEQIEITPATSERFLSILSQPARLVDILRGLHELRVLEKIIPGMEHARCLLQFNDYHKYTVDEHCFRSVGHATEFLRDRGPLGDAYRSIKRKRTLHLALLLHDLGKGYSEDHSQIGKRLAQETTELLGLGQREGEKLVLLVHRHLMMSHLAFRRDTSDEALIVQFAVDVGTPDTLKMLFVLTCADLAAVGPGKLNAWKVEVLTSLYLRTMKHLAGDMPSIGADPILKEKRRQIHAKLLYHENQDWLQRQIGSLPTTYLRWAEEEQIVEELIRLEKLTPEIADAWARYLPDHGVVQFTVGAYDQLTSGIFYKLTGALSSRHLSILSADIYTFDGGLVLDRFYVEDLHHNGEPPKNRLRDVRKDLVSVLTDSNTKPAFGQVWTSGISGSQTSLAELPTRVEVDNSTSDQYTILDVFAHDRLGLLYIITRTLFELGLSVAVAKIGTYVDQVVDVFYVMDHLGKKIKDERRISTIKSRLLEAVASEVWTSEDEDSASDGVGIGKTSI